MLPSAPRRAIRPQEREIYERDGVVCLDAIFSLEWIDFLAGAVEEAMAAPGLHAEEYTPRGGSGRFFGDLELAERLPSFRRFALESPAAEIAGRIMGACRVRFLYDQLLVKEPGTRERTPWHQDQPYWAVSGRQVSSVWLPLDPVPLAAAVEYVGGSHLWPEYSPYHFSDGTPYAETGLAPLPDIEAERGRHPIVRFAMEPGDCLLFQAMIVARRARESHSCKTARARYPMDRRRRTLLSKTGRGRHPDGRSRSGARRAVERRTFSPRVATSRVTHFSR